MGAETNMITRKNLLLASTLLVLGDAGFSAARAQSNEAPAAAPAAATPATPAQPVTALDAVTSTATRTAQPIGSVPSTVTIIDSEQINRQSAVRPQDLTRYEPGISYSNQPLRGGGGNFVIRGIGDNRVRVLTDGVPMPDFPESNIGAGTFTRDFTDLETVRRVEIVRGPASALYGSDAIGGVVNFITKDPRDYLLPGRSTFFSGRFGYSGADNSFTESITGAATAGQFDAMAMYTRRDGNELQPNGNLSPNPQDYHSNSFLGRVVWNATPSDTFRFTGQVLQRSVDTDIRTEQGTTGTTTIQSSKGEDYTSVSRLQADYFRTTPILFVDSLEVRTYYTFLDRRERTYQNRYTGPSTAPYQQPPTTLRFTDTRQEQSIAGTDVQFHSAFDIGGIRQNLTYGFSVEWVDTSRPRDRYQVTLATGAVNRTVAGETFPNKNFPDTTTWQTGVFLQDEFTIGRFTFLPAVRFDWYSLTANPDAAFLRSAQQGLATQVQDINDFAVSPKLGITYQIDPTYQVYGQYSRGFRAPPYDTANFGFTNFAFGYTILPNGDLKSEYVNSFEIGARGRYDNGSSIQFAAFYNRYKDFISTQTIGTNAQGLTVFQYQNIGKVEIYGAEARGEWRFHPEWTLTGAAAYARGEDMDTGQPLDGVDPFRVMTGLGWQASPDSRFHGLGTDVNVTGALRNSRTATATEFKTPGYVVVDLLAHYDFTQNLTVNAGIFNVFNTQYFLVPDVAGLSATNPLIDLYAQPGRYFAANVTARF